MFWQRGVRFASTSAIDVDQCSAGSPCNSFNRCNPFRACLKNLSNVGSPGLESRLQAVPRPDRLKAGLQTGLFKRALNPNPYSNLTTGNGQGRRAYDYEKPVFMGTEHIYQAVTRIDAATSQL